jgi:hypothetical protein
MEEKDVRTEIDEAIYAGERAVRSLHAAEEELTSAKNWSIFDLIGGGLISSIVKHSKMDKASESISLAKRNLRTFENELKDISVYKNINIETGDFLYFADVFLDSFIADWMVHDKINETLDQIQTAIDRTNAVLRDLYKL